MWVEFNQHMCFTTWYLEFSFHCRCAEPANELRRCYDVGYNTFCFFRPESGYKLMKKKGAYQTCHRNNATLLAIPSEEAQNALEIYMKFLKLEHSHELWMAGQEVRGREWKWLNGRTANLTASQLRGRPTLNPTPYSNLA